MNQKYFKLLPLFYFLVTLSYSTVAQKTLSTTDQSLRYSNYARLGLKIIPIKLSDTTYKIQFIAEKIEENAILDTYQLSYTLLTSYEEELQSEKKIKLSAEQLLASTERHWLFETTVEIPQSQGTAITLFEAVDSRQQDTYTVHLDLKSPFVFDQPDFGYFFANAVPFDQNYLTQGQSLLFKTSKGPFLFSFFYPSRFAVPFPPMETRIADVPKEVIVENRGDFLENIPKTLTDEGYYFFQSDSTAQTGLLLRTVHDAFPKVKDWNEMVDMVTYISTKKEHESLLLAQDKKKALDAFWINLTRNEEVAKDLIRNYFKMVELANILFTDFKEGWKTDRGMVYIVMGPPQEVNFFEDREVWSYAGIDDTSKIRYNFTRVKTILSPHFYTLNRSKAYQPIWFKNISQWRSGRMAF
ncbi:MAG: GWxTD domain-containing protein [Bacteroidetes bacterium]|nr:GWxTD domain-containing protein [Bacteroidota bacterium]